VAARDEGDCGFAQLMVDGRSDHGSLNLPRQKIRDLIFDQAKS